MVVREERSYAAEGQPPSSNFVWRNWNAITTVLGIACAIGVWGMAVTTVDDHQKIGIYLIFCGIIISFLEITFKLEQLFGCCSEKSFARRCWLVILAIDNWKRGLLYLALSVVCFMDPKEAWQILVAGVLMDLCGLLYFIKTVRSKTKAEPYKYKQLSIT